MKYNTVKKRRRHHKRGKQTPETDEDFIAIFKQVYRQPPENLIAEMETRAKTALEQAVTKTTKEDATQVLAYAAALRKTMTSRKIEDTVYCAIYLGRSYEKMGVRYFEVALVV